MSQNIPKNLETVISEGYTVKNGEYLDEGWKICQQKLGLFVGFYVIWIIIWIALGQVDERIGAPVNFLISAPLSAGFTIAALQIVKRQKTVIGDFFKGFQYLGPLVLANVAMSIISALGMILLIIPGIYLAVSYFFTIHLILDRKMDFWPAMETSRKIVTKRWFSIFGFGLVLGLINLGGALLLGLGLLVTVPLSSCAIVAAYDDIIGVESTNL
ncbi:MAG: hypothetical protein AB4352_29470 [Hormoscilla sp.]